MDNKQSAEIGMAAGVGLAAMAMFPPSFYQTSQDGLGRLVVG